MPRSDNASKVIRGRLLATVGLLVLLSGCSLQELGRNIPQKDIETDYLVGLCWALALAASIFVWPVRRSDKQPLAIVWTAKVFVTLVVMLFYEWSYGLDAYSYFDIPRRSDFFASWPELGAGSENMARLGWLQMQVLPESYHALKVTCAYLGLIGVYLIYRAAVLFLRVERVRVFYALALFPSVLFWSSILGKDPLALLGVGVYVYGVMAWYRSNRTRYLAVVVLGVYLAMLIRIWMGPILMAPLAVFGLARVRSAVSKAALIGVGVGLFVWALSGVLQRFNLETSQDIYAQSNTVSRAWAVGGSGKQIEQEFTGAGSMIAFVPLGIIAALFRPFPGEIMNVFGILAGLENAFLIYLTWRAIRSGRLADFGEPAVTWCALVVLVWATVYGFVSYQNLGSAVRFRLQVLPLLLAVVLYLGRHRPQRLISRTDTQGLRRPTAPRSLHNLRERADENGPLAN